MPTTTGDFGLYKLILSQKLLLSLFSTILIALSGFSSMALQNVIAQQPPSPTSNGSEFNNTTSASKGHLSMVLLNQIKPMILKNLGNKSRGGVSIVVGVITPNGTSVSGYGNISKANTTK